MNNISVFPLLLKHRIDKSNRCAIAIRIVRDRKVIATKTIGYKIEPAQWDDVTRKVKTSQPNHSMLNTLIKNKVGEYEGEFMKSQLLGVPMTNTKIKKVAKGDNMQQDYFAFCEEVIPVKYPKPSQKETRRQHTNELSKLKQFREQVTFADMDVLFLQQYKAWMINERKNTDNTVWKTFKAMYAMTNEALRRGGYLAESPFKNFDRGRYKQGRRAFLNMEDCIKIEQLAFNAEVDTKIRTVAYYYLFMCYTGLRFRDAVVYFDYNKHVVDGERIVMTTEKFKVDIDLLIHGRLWPVLEYIRFNRLLITNQDFNKYLRDVQSLSGVQTGLSAHIGRHTFGTMLAELDVPIEKAQRLLGHRDLESTKIYYHIKNKSLDKEMRKFENLG